MSQQYDVDTLIIGQGLAGSLLAWTLLQHNQRVLVLDNDYATASSTAAAGLINPVTGQRIVKTVGVDDYLPQAHRLYRALEKALGDKLLFELPMWRLLRTEKEHTVWHKRKQDPAYHDYLGEWLTSEQLQPHFTAPLGGFIQYQTGYLDTQALLYGIRHVLQQSGSYRQHHIDYRDIELTATGAKLDGVTARRVIFCEGYKALENPWFNWLPFIPAKGEILSLQLEQSLPQVMINAGRWLMPRANGEYRLGATYEHEQLNEQITDQARQTLLEALPQILSHLGAYRVIGQQAGVRPATRDRQPFIGRHPQFPQLSIFNGFGSKGSLLIPWHAKRFAEAMQGNETLPEVCDIKRHR